MDTFNNGYDLANQILTDFSPESIEHKEAAIYLEQCGQLSELAGDDDNPFNPYVDEYIEMEQSFMKSMKERNVINVLGNYNEVVKFQSYDKKQCMDFLRQHYGLRGYKDTGVTFHEQNRTLENLRLECKSQYFIINQLPK